MHFYSNDIKPVALRKNAQYSSAIIDSLIIFVFPWRMWGDLTNYLLAKSGISDSLTYPIREITETVQCDFTKQSPIPTLYW